MKGTLTPAASPLALLAAGMALLAPRAGRAAAPTYRLQPIVRLGDQVADVTIKRGGFIAMGTLNDSGQIAFVTLNAAGGEMLLQYADGQLIPIVVGGRDAPGGKWAGSVIPHPVGMNQRGDIAFAAGATIGGATDYGTFRWDYQSRKVTPVALQGMTAVNNLSFVYPRLNNRDRSVLIPMQLAGAPWGIYRWANGQFTRLLAVGHDMPGGGQLKGFGLFGANDAGQFAIQGLLSDGSTAAYLLDTDGTLSLILKSGTMTNLGTITQIELRNNAGLPNNPPASIKGIGLNNQGQVALPVQIDNGPDTLVLLTPAAP